MPISRIHISNFRSFDDVEIELGNFNVLVGANASGKSNLLQALKFIQDIKNSGLENAISELRGFNFLKNVNIQKNTLTLIKLNFKPIWGDILIFDDKYNIGLIYDNIQYLFSFKEDYQGSFKILDEKIIYESHPFIIANGLNTNVNRIEYLDIKIKHEISKFGTGLITYNDDIEHEVKLPNGEILKLKNNKLIPFSIQSIPLNKPLLNANQTLLEEYPKLLPTEIMDFKIFDFDIKNYRIKKPSGKIDLSSNGENIPIVLQKVLADKKKKRLFFNVLTDILPFINDVKVERYFDNSLIMLLDESYNKGKFLPDFLLSDGTISVVFLILALYFDENKLLIFEEPEKNIHPALISRLMQHFYDVSTKKQIVITTHSPEILKHSNIEDLYLISRNDEGFSEISKPANQEMVKAFLANDLGIDELFVQNLLDI